MYNNLKRLMKQKGITQRQIGLAIGTSRQATISTKIAEGIDFTFEDACKIHDTFFPEYNIRYVFEKDNQLETVQA